MGLMRRLWWVIGGAVGVVAVSVFSCSYVALPGGWTVNFPGFSGDPIPRSEVSRRLHVPPGFSVDAYAGGIENARFLRFSEAGDLLVSAPRQGKVYLLERDRDGDGYADGQRVLLDGLDQPHGLAIHDGWLYVAETDAVLRVRFDAEAGSVTSQPERIVTGLPGGGNHWTRTIGVGPDERLYVSIGSSCNVCIEKDPRRAAILSYAIDGSDERLHATGLRNSVGFAWRPGTGDLYATDNGRDLLGDDFPPCELNRVVAGGFYGWPFANGMRVPDPDYGAGHEREIAASIPPAHGFPAHTAPLGITFYDHGGRGAFPDRYDGAAFVALHGSWNRSRKIGYEVVSLTFRPDGTIDQETFLSGFLAGESVSGRPVDVAVGPDGALYVSDDFTGAIYRVAYGIPAAGATPKPPVPAPAVPSPATAPAEPSAAADPAERAAAIERGRALWTANDCARCHVAGAALAAQGAGAETIRPLAGLAGKYFVSSLATYLRTPQPPMPAFPLTDGERRDLALYLLATYP
jgi:glucose/arabinose dehydrogenase